MNTTLGNNTVEMHSALETPTKYPIYFARVQGRILEPQKFNKAGRPVKRKAIHFDEKFYIKCYPNTFEPIHKRSYFLATKYGSLKERELIYDEVMFCIADRYTTVKD